MKKTQPPKVSGRHSHETSKVSQTPKERVMTKLELITTSEHVVQEVPAAQEMKQNFNALLKDLEEFQEGSKPLSTDLVNCLETQLRLLLAKKRNPNGSGPDFDPEPPPGGATALPVPTDSTPTVVRMSA
jgi:hypothetical protein